MIRFSVGRGFAATPNTRKLRFAALTILIASATIARSEAQLTVTGYAGAAVAMNPAGNWSITVPSSHWIFAGNIGASAIAPHVNTGKDQLGSFQEIAFDYTLGGSRSASIRIYQSRPVAFFSVTWNDAATNSTPFPIISTYPAALGHVSFNGQFAPGEFTHLIPESPWAFFDPAGNTFILSPAANFMTASTNRLNDNSIAMGISPQITTLPAGFTHRTALVFGKGINQTFETWGGMLTTLKGKKRPSNEADALLRSISYWTDNGATYYYNSGSDSYSNTLHAVKKEFDSKGIRLGSLQLDSWWYPKGPDNNWSSHNGIWTYTASPALFQPDLNSFQTGMKTPLVTHARWIDANSPYRSQYAISGNMPIDPKYWDDTAAYLKASGVTTYEQDWLGQQAHTDFNLTDPELFLNGMANSMAKKGITIQYCMGTPAHFLQSTNYNNVTTIRTSQDRFRREIWSDFFYSSRLASSLGVWPFSDVFMSTETSNLIAANLSAGPLGIGDPVGKISRENLIRAVRADGVIVKPDVPATPLDSVFQSDATGADTPMIASTYTDFGEGYRTHYIFAFTRGANKTITIDPAQYGITGSAYLYDSLQDTGRLIDHHGTFTLDLNDGVGYFVLAPVGPSGIAMLGDKDMFVSMGKKRVPAFTDNGNLEMTVAFAPGESMRTIFGYSPTPVMVASVTGSHAGMTWDGTGQIFTVNLHPAAGKATVHLWRAGNPVSPVGCGSRCTGIPLPGVGAGQ